MTKPKLFPLGILVSDTHGSHKAPAARAHEPSWYDAQRRQFRALRQLQERLQVPVFHAGDVTDKWNPPPELLNMMLEELPEMWAIPGQHDLAYHEYETLNRTGFGTLLAAGKIKLLCPKNGRTFAYGKFRLYVQGFPWGAELTPCKTNAEFKLAVVHHYIWTGNSGFVGAAETDNAAKLAKKLKGFDAAVFGDNHTPFEYTPKSDGCRIFNHGGFFRRKSDEHVPAGVGILYSDGSIIRHPFTECYAQDIVERSASVKCAEQREDSDGLKTLITELNKRGATFDFREAVQLAVRRLNPTKPVRRLISKSLDPHE